VSSTPREGEEDREDIGEGVTELVEDLSGDLEEDAGDGT
jgi:hypothetical protein